LLETDNVQLIVGDVCIVTCFLEHSVRGARDT